MHRVGCVCARVCMCIKQSVHLHLLGPFSYFCVLRESFSVLKTLCLGEPWPAGVLVSLALGRRTVCPLRGGSRGTHVLNCA